MNWPTQPPLSSLGTVQIGSTPSSAHSTNWPVFNLGNICSVRRGTTITQNQAKPGAIPVVAGGLAATYFHDTPNRKSNVITVSASGASAGFVNYWKTPIFASDCSTVESESPDVCIKYVFHFLRGKQEYIYSKLRSGAAQPHVYAKDIAALNILLPPLPEQRRTAAILDQADALRAKRREALAQLDSLTQSIFIEMFGDPVTNPKGWPRKQTANIGKIITGNTPPRANPDNYGDAIEWIKSDNINTPHYYVTGAQEGLSEMGKSIARIAPAGSILVTCIAGSPDCIGNAAMTDREVAFNQQINAFIPERGDAHFYYAQIIVGKRLIQEASTAGMKGMVSKGKFEQIKLIVPPAYLQCEFARRVAAAEKLNITQRASLTELDALFASLQHRAFRGEL